MKKELLLSFLCGTVLPLAVVIAAGRIPPEPTEPTAPEPVQETVPVTEETAAAPRLTDADYELQVLRESGETERMDLERYLLGVVLAEMPAEFEPEALKAQAVVARTYTCRRMDQGKHASAAVCTDPGCCQAYRSREDYLEAGGQEEAVEKVLRAVRETAGEVLTYEGELIDATYFSCSGGFTEDAVEVWGQDIPYLQAVESPGEEMAPRFREEKSFSPEAFRLLTGVEGSGSPESWFGEPVLTDGGGVDRMEICGKTFTGPELRKLLGLRSTAFGVEIRGEEIVFVTRGFGHRVGMSQYGAEAMARSGSGYREILSHYYRDTELEPLYRESE